MCFGGDQKDEITVSPNHEVSLGPINYFGTPLSTSAENFGSNPATDASKLNKFGYYRATNRRGRITSAPVLKVRIRGKVRFDLKWDFLNLVKILVAFAFSFASNFAYLGESFMDTSFVSILCCGASALSPVQVVVTIAQSMQTS